MVMTVRHDHTTHAMTANAVASVSLDPPLVLICIEKSAQSHALVAGAQAFALTVLGERQQDLGERFAYDAAARADPCSVAPCFTAVTGAPIFCEGLGYLDCRVVATYPGGDHSIFVAEVVAANVTAVSEGPLLYYGSKFHKPGDSTGD